MKNYLKHHPILEIPTLQLVDFNYKGTCYQAAKGSMISSALMANGIDVIGHHHKDKRAQGLFCANG